MAHAGNFLADLPKHLWQWRPFAALGGGVILMVTSLGRHDFIGVGLGFSVICIALLFRRQDRESILTDEMRESRRAMAEQERLDILQAKDKTPPMRGFTED